MCSGFELLDLGMEDCHRASGTQVRNGRKNTYITIYNISIWMFLKIVVPQNGWFIMENPIKMDELGVFPYFWKHPYQPNTHEEPPKSSPKRQLIKRNQIINCTCRWNMPLFPPIKMEVGTRFPEDSFPLQ